MKRAGVVAGIVLVVLALAASLSWTSSRTLVIVDEQGAPATGAYVRYHYEGQIINFAHPLSYVARPSEVVRANATGEVTIPWRLHARRPLPLSLPPVVHVDEVYVPRLHNAFGPISPFTTSTPGVFEVDDAERRITVADVSGSPERWEQSLSYLFQMVRRAATPRAAIAPDDARSRQYARELAGHLRAEYDALLTRYGDTERPRPADPAAESRWAQDPSWRTFLSESWRYNFKTLLEVEAQLE